MDPIYLDYAAATPVSKSVMTAMAPYFTEKFYNPSALYLSAQSVGKDLSAARETVAKTLGARGSEIIFTAGGTEANNLAIHGLLQLHPQAKVLVSAIEHDSVLAPAHTWNRTLLGVDSDGRIDLVDLKKSIDDSTLLISVGYVNNEIGTVQPLQKIREIITQVLADRRARSIDLPLFLHTDACQAGNYLSLNVHKLGVDMMTINGGKLYGPKQSGALYVRAGIDLKPLISGGGQEFSKRSGTENVAFAIGLAMALEVAQSKRHTETTRITTLQGYFIDRLKQLGVCINGSESQRIANNVHIRFDGKDNERLMMELDERRIMAAVGSACSASKDTPSHVLRAIGLSETEARSSLRFTLGQGTTKEQIDYVCDQLYDLR